MSYNTRDASNVIERMRLRTLYASYAVKRKEVEEGCVQRFELDSKVSQQPNMASTYIAITKGALFTTSAELESYEDFACDFVIRVPDAPTNLTQADLSGNVTTDTTIAFSFTVPSAGSSPILDYEYSLDGITYTPLESISNVVELTDLQPNTQYSIVLRAVSLAGAGPASAPLVVTTEAPSTPTGTLFTLPSTSPNVTVAAVSPFEGANSYLFNGSSSYLTVESNDSWDLGTGDFTIEWFQYKTDTNLYTRIFSIGSGASGNPRSIGCSIERSGGGPSSTFYSWFSNAIASPPFPNSVVNYNTTWIHFAIVRRAGILRIYKNGSQIGVDIPNTTNITNSTPLHFGVEAGLTANTWFGGYLTSIRIVKGLAVYTGAFTTPTSPLTVVASANPYGGSNTKAIPDGFTKLLLNPVLD
jgi:hypothetical protein